MKSLILLILITTTQLFALISIVPVEIGHKAGYSGSVELGLQTKRGNTHKDSYSSSLLLNYDNNSSYVLWMALSGEYAEANNVEDTNKLYSHLRFIHALTEKNIRYELFLQAQEDQFKAIEKRRVAGAGFRFNLFNIVDGGKGYAGIGGLYEYIRHTDSSIDPNEDNIRINSYLAYTQEFNEDSHMAYTLYYQPRVDKFNDHVISNKFELKLHVYLKLFLKFSVYYDVDSSPPNNLDYDYDFGQSTTFVYDF